MLLQTHLTTAGHCIRLDGENFKVCLDSQHLKQQLCEVARKVAAGAPPLVMGRALATSFLRPIAVGPRGWRLVYLRPGGQGCD